MVPARPKPAFLPLALLLCAAAQAQPVSHVQWSAQIQPSSAAPGAAMLARITAKIDPGWHIYSGSSLGGIPSSFKPSGPADLSRTLQPAPKRAFDPTLNAEIETYENEVTFLLDLRVKKDAQAGPAELPIAARFQTCDVTQCIPGKLTIPASFTVDPAATTPPPAIPPGYTEVKTPARGAQDATQPAPANQGWASFLAVAFGLGLLSIFTPCVFPMIPITMSYFLNQQSGAKRDGIVQAVVFCLGIVVLFSGIGLLVTAALGPFGVVKLGQSPWVSGFIAALFIAFGLSLLGAFEITIPSSVLTKLNQSSGKGGFAGTLLMGLTFSLASFACVGPFVGTLLAASVSAGGARTVAGMVTFASGLAAPFFLLALFPSWLKRMPRSGGWLARVKVVMGFVILAASLKYLSSVDQVLHWDALTRGRFLAAWVILFAMAGFYLLGFLRLEGIKPDESLGLGRLLTGMLFLIFAISLLPGMFGGRLGELEAYIPQAEAGAGGLGGGSSQTALVWLKDQYRAALDQARREGKLVFVNFTGYACTNCHWMKANMFTRPEIAAELQKFVLVDLYADGDDAVSEANQKLELGKFNSVSQPYYAILDPDENVIATFPGLTHDAAEFLAFLRKGAAPPAAPGVAAKTSGEPSGVPHFAKLDGGTVDDTAGKVVVIDFWATYCVPCIKEIPTFSKLQKDFGSKGLKVLGVAMDEEGASLVRPFLQKHPMDYTVALGSEAIAKQFNLESYPLTLVFDRTGKIIKRFEGFTPPDELRAAVQQAL